MFVSQFFNTMAPTPAFTDAVARLLEASLNAAPCTEEHFWALLQHAHKMWLLVEGATTTDFAAMVVPLVADDPLKAKLAFGLLFELLANEHGVGMKKAEEEEEESEVEAPGSEVAWGKSDDDEPDP